MDNECNNFDFSLVTQQQKSRKQDCSKKREEKRRKKCRSKCGGKKRKSASEFQPRLRIPRAKCTCESRQERESERISLSKPNLA